MCLDTHMVSFKTGSRRITVPCMVIAHMSETPILCFRDMQSFWSPALLEVILQTSEHDCFVAILIFISDVIRHPDVDDLFVKDLSPQLSQDEFLLEHYR